MARFTTAGGSGSGAPGPQGPQGPAGEDAVLPQDLGTTDSPTFSKITLTSNGATDNITIGDDVILGDGNIANHVVIIGQQDATQGGVVLGSNETESISTDAINLSLTANNDIILNPGSNYAYIGTPQLDGSNRIAKMSDITGGSGANIADFIFTNDSENTGRSIISLPGDKGMTIEAGVDSDLYITAGDDLYIQTLGQGDDIHLNAADDIRFTTNNEDAEFETVHQWSMDSEGRLQLPGSGYISNPIDSSGDGYGNDTIVLTPDTENGSADQQIIIDPTAPNHIHIRAGGVQDYSSAELILGGERAGVHVSDQSGSVTIQAKKEDLSWSYDNINDVEGTVFRVNTSVAEPDYNDFMIYDGIKYIVNNVTRSQVDNTTEYSAISSTGTQFSFFPGWNYTFKRAMGEWSWTFNEGGYISGPNEGGILVYDIEKNDGGDLFVTASEGGRVVLNGSSGEYLNDPTVSNNQIATIGDINNLASGEVSFTVNGGTLGTQPTFDGAPLFSGTYVKTGPMVHFQIQVDMDNILTFGDGQYVIDLPFPAKYGYQFKEGCLHDISSGKQYAIGGHVYAGQSQIGLTFTNSAGQDEDFDHNSPVTLSTADNFHISGTYISN